MRRRIGEIAGPDALLRGGELRRLPASVVYGLSTLRVVLRYVLHRIGVRRSPKLTARTPETEPPAA
jgi:hypothetical protein